jgi:cyclopropane-fatty-acyl-phospholipid synthase
LISRAGRSLLLRGLRQIRRDRVRLIEGSRCLEFGQSKPEGLDATLEVFDSRVYRMLVLGGSLAAAEAYIRGYWDSPDLASALRVIGHHAASTTPMDRALARVAYPLLWAANWLRRNTRIGSRRNIAAHYDLSNEFFSLMLDPTMTYSCGIFPARTSSMQEASQEKYDRICRILRLTQRDHVLEVGCGWGGFAVHAARNYGCRVTALTISRAQHGYATSQVRAAGLGDRVSVVLRDYRDATGQFDKLVSIEMIEAVGRQFLDGYFGQCCRLLKPDGVMALQAITITDNRYEQYRRSVDFIQQYVFPGGFLPSFSAMGKSWRRATDFRPIRFDEFSPHYAETLRRWRQRFRENIESVRRLGFDERFIRTWNYYLCYCEAAFEERLISVSQIFLAREACRETSIELAG